jgi:hydrogenase expression/formation protein HypC
MCLSIPSKVVEIDKELNLAVVDTMGVTRKAGLDLVEEGSVKVGDYVLIHIGFVMNKIDEEDALESLKVYNEILEKLDEEERERLVLEDDNCENRTLQ